MTRYRWQRDLPAGYKQAYFLGKPVNTHPEPNWLMLRTKARKDLSLSAQLKLEWIIFYHTLGNKNASLTASQFGITRKSIHK